jgi:hypothetical protein
MTHTLIPALSKLRREDCKFEPSQGNIARFSHTHTHPKNIILLLWCENKIMAKPLVFLLCSSRLLQPQVRLLVYEIVELASHISKTKYEWRVIETQVCNPTGAQQKHPQVKVGIKARVVWGSCGSWYEHWNFAPFLRPSPCPQHFRGFPWQGPAGLWGSQPGWEHRIKVEWSGIGDGEQGTDFLWSSEWTHSFIVTVL